VEQNLKGVFNEKHFENKSRVAILLKLRLWALAGQALMIVPGLKIQWLLSENLPGYLGVLASSLVVTLISNAALRKDSFEVTQGFVFFQLALDALSLSILLMLSGGPWNPFAPFLLFHGAVGAMFLRGNWVRFFVVFLLFCLLLLHANPSVPPALYTQPTPSSTLFPAQSILLFFLVCLLVWVSNKWDLQKSVLARVRFEKDQVDRLRAFGIIATGFSHEFSTPLATLRLRLARLRNLECLEENTDLSEALAAASQAEASLRSLMHQKFLPAESDFVPLEVFETLHQIVDQWDEGKNCVEFVGTSITTWVKAPPVSFAQMIIDLLDNSLRANQENEKSKIIVELKAQKDTIELTIADEGVGFPKWILDHIGTPFFSTQTGGTGLGLYHAHILCAALGGGLKLQNCESGGAKVSLFLSRFSAIESL
jgi:two-component system, sensor histidine kinase RegB